MFVVFLFFFIFFFFFLFIYFFFTEAGFCKMTFLGDGLRFRSLGSQGFKVSSSKQLPPWPDYADAKPIWVLYECNCLNVSLVTTQMSQRTTKPTIRRVTSKLSDQPVYPPSTARILVYSSLDSLDSVEGTLDKRRHWSDCADAQADLSLRWSHILL